MLRRLLGLLAALWIFRTVGRVARLLLGIGVVLLALGGCGAIGLIDRATQHADAVDTARARLLAVVDGDTLRVEIDGRVRRIRLLGVDSPEKSDLRVGSASCGARQATAFVVRRLYRHPVDRDEDGLVDAGSGARQLTLLGDPTADDHDRFGRLLRYVKVRGARTTLQEQLLRAGYAAVFDFDGHGFARRAQFKAAAARARREHRGVWRLCGGDFNTAAHG